MRLAIFDAVKSLKIINIPEMNISDDQVLIKVNACAICTWEQRVYTGVREVPFPFVGGHEISGEVIKIGKNVDQRNVKVGDKVVHGTLLSCGNCYQCKIGNEQNCLHLNHAQPLAGTDFVGMGGFSEYMVAYPHNLYQYNNIDTVEASLIEPVSCCVHSVESAHLQFGETVMIVGCGIMGLIHVQLALHRGCRVVAVDLNEKRLLDAKELGAHYVINNSKENLDEKVNEIVKGNGVDVIFNTTPYSNVANEIQKYLSIQGRQVLYSSFYPDNPLNISPDRLHKHETNIIGTANSNPRDFIRAINLVEYGIINLKPFITKEYHFDEIVDAMEEAIKGNNYRIVIKF